NGLKYLKKFEVAIYGSYVSGFFNSRSDIDIAIVTRKTDPKQNKEIWKNALKKSRQNYHLNVFELLPLNVKAEIMDNFIALFGDRIEISEYFYHFRKLWKDAKHRHFENQFSNFKEKISKIKATV
ncbi:MAG: nucleotidyltransferase domain-containing protein, partial [archaeon]